MQDRTKISSAQSAEIYTSVHRAGGIAVADRAIIIISTQAAEIVYSVHRTVGFAVADRAIIIISAQAAEIVISAYRAGNIAVDDRAIISSAQAAEIVISVHRAGDITVADRAIIFSAQSGEIVRFISSGNIEVYYTKVFDHRCRTSYSAKQAEITASLNIHIIYSITITVKTTSKRRYDRG